MAKNAITKQELQNLHKVLIALLDYIQVIKIYFALAFWMAVIVDGYLLPPYNVIEEDKKCKYFTVIYNDRIYCQFRSLQIFFHIWSC